MYKIIKKLIYRRDLSSKARARRNWAINVYKTSDPILGKLSSLSEQPVIRGGDATDIDAAFVCDPFLTVNNNTYYMFFEIFNNSTQRGEIAYAISNNGIEWQYQKVILRESFHLSYPYVFSFEGEYYMIPESSEDFSVRLYKATEFPSKWKCVDTILRGYRFVDASVIFHNDYWWLFVSTRDNDSLNLYFAERPVGPWVLHNKSPLIKNNNSMSRPGGRLITLNNTVYRYAQDCHEYYGKNLVLLKITNLTTTEYREDVIMNSVFSNEDRDEWNKLGVHHIDHCKISENEWIVAVDGFDRFGDSR